MGLGLAGQPAQSSITGRRQIERADRGASARRWCGGTRNSNAGPVTMCRTSSSTVLPPTDRQQTLKARRPFPASTRLSCKQTAKRGCSLQPAWLTVRYLPTTSRRSPRFRTSSTTSSTTRSARSSAARRTVTSRAATRPGSDVFPYVTTTYRLTEHHTAGGMSRFLPYLSELQPALFCEVSPQLAAERGLEHLAGRRSSRLAAP